MAMRIVFGIMVVGLATCSAQATESAVQGETHATVEKTSGDERTNAYLERYRATQRAMYDTLSGDPTPQVQVLAGRANLSDQDEATPSALRPKRADVIARAAQAGSEDAFVQWMAASQGSFTSSQCGATVWPEAEVANLVRLEPDNAAAWQFAVALAAARGSQSAVDDALAQMASATIADDHFSDELNAWQRVYAAYPELAKSFGDPEEEEGESSTRSVLALALRDVGNRSNPAMSTLEAACKPDAEQEITWQRAAWCADAATVFVNRGTSLALRGQGLKLLAIVGDRSPGIADWQRTQTWLVANSANPSENYRAMEDTDADRASDWRGDVNDVVATARRLQRLGQPLTAPIGWVSPEDQQASDERAARTVWRDYLRTLIDGMRSGGDVDAQGAGAAAESIIVQLDAMSDSSASAATPTGHDASPTPDAKSAAARALVAAAQAHPDRVLVQWLTAASTDDSAEDRAAAAANIQRVEPDNAAAWALSLGGIDNDALAHAAAGTRFDSHTSGLLRVWLDAVAAHPALPGLAESLSKVDPSGRVYDDKGAQIVTASTMAFSTIETTAPLAVSRACAGSGKAVTGVDRESCIALGRLMLRSGTSMVSALFGEMVLRKLDALEPADEARAAIVKQGRMTVASFDADALAAYVRDYVATGSEVDALRNATDRAATSTPQDTARKN